MPLDDLVSVIETLQQRIRDHGDTLRQNEYRTRMALIDPLLTALGWDVADPGLVTPEYNVGNGRADYALLVPSNKPTALVEAKHLGEQLESPSHQEQVFTYALMQQVKYAGLTDGNRWVLDDVSDFSGERRKLDITIANMPAHQCALKFLLLWRSNLASGNTIPAREPLLPYPQPQPVPAQTALPTIISPPVGTSAASTTSEGWVLLPYFVPKTGTPPPTAIMFPDSQQKPVKRWRDVLTETVSWLFSTGALTLDNSPISVGPSRYLVSTSPVHASGTAFHSPKEVNGTPFIVETSFVAPIMVKHVRTLLSSCGHDPASVKVNPS